MSQHVRDRLARLQRRSLGTMVVRGASLLVAVVFGAVLLAGLFDWLVHLDDAGVRCLLAVTILGGATWIVFRYLITPLLQPPSEVALALAAERRFPQLRDTLASSAAFTDGELDPLVGSPALQRRTIVETERRLAGLPIESIVPTRGAQRAAVAAIAVCLVVAFVAANRPTEAGTALHRLFAPFGAPAWPRETVLVFRNERLESVELDPATPLRMARGETLELFVVNDVGPLPPEVLLETRVGEGGVASQPLRRVTLAASNGTTAEAFKIAFPVERPGLAFRVVGGDDREQDFQPIEVLPPPSLESLRVTLAPPSYLGEPEEELPEGVGHVTGMVGTRVSIVARTTVPVVRARLHVREREPIEIEPANGGRTLETSFVLERPGMGAYWLQLVDEEGIENVSAVRYEIRATADRVPDVTIDEPETDLRVTVEAVVPLGVTARDDVGLERLELVTRIERSDGTREAPERTTLREVAAGEESDRAQYDGALDLTEIELAPGDRLVVRAEAHDRFEPAGNSGGDHVGRSLERNILVVSEADKLREIVSKQAVLEGELEEVAEAQRRSGERTEEIEVQWRSVGRLRDADVDQFESAELEQRRIGTRLTDPVEGVLPRARRLLAELEDNGLDAADVRSSLESIVDELDLLADREIPEVESDLVRARKLALAQRENSGDEAAAEGRDALAKAIDGQTLVRNSLDDLVRTLSRTRGRRELELDLDALLAGQREIRDRTAELVERTFNRRFAELPEQDRAELEKLAAAQRSRADETERLLRGLEAAAKGLAESAPEAAELAGDAADLLRERATTARMEDLVDQLRPRDDSDVVRAGGALADQERLLGDLAEVRSALDDRLVNDTAARVEELRRAGEELETLRKEQEEILRKAQEARSLVDEAERERSLEKLAKEQDDLRRRVDRLARRARRLQAPSAAAAVRRASDRMEDVERLLKQDRAGDLDRAEREVLDELDQAERDLDDARRRAEEQLAREMLESIKDDLKAMVERQKSLVDETVRLQLAIEERGGTPSRSMVRTITGLAEVQRSLATETDGLAEQLAAAEVFVVALRGASERMRVAADRLAGRAADARTLEAQREALARLRALASAFEDEPEGANEGAPPNDEPAPDVPGNEEPPPELVSLIVQLRLLKALQETLVERTERLDEARREETLTAEESDAELDAIAVEQDRIAALVRELARGLLRDADTPPDVELDLE